MAVRKFLIHILLSPRSAAAFAVSRPVQSRTQMCTTQNLNSPVSPGIRGILHHMLFCLKEVNRLIEMAEHKCYRNTKGMLNILSPSSQVYEDIIKWLLETSKAFKK